ncbi:hypothetical protein FIBSPDRAFT_957133 [Athelia psychrophila]|uniref:NACHT-NTPase and P-loop NTPases N-terminal domain-containing protein n=1 Tax=Athelia psychrophila TaxID=1759441 RepID=A0A166G6C0_9AGAM|nr:hypothetical protein FIBSPDRAFT_957133 [Fibularhizoctonia sp. CBS 109695]
MTTLNEIAKGTGVAALALLHLTVAASGAFPPLQLAAQGALDIAQLVQRFKSNQTDWRAFGEYTKNIVACIVRVLPDGPHSREDIKRNIAILIDALDDTDKKIRARLEKPLYIRFYKSLNDLDTIKDMKVDLDHALSLFHLESMMTTGFDVAKIVQGMDPSHLHEYIDLANQKLCNDIISSTQQSTVELSAQIESVQEDRRCEA